MIKSNLSGKGGDGEGSIDSSRSQAAVDTTATDNVIGGIHKSMANLGSIY
jgi:hypothetical protein